MTRQEPTTIAILGADTVVENALAQLLEGKGYATTVLKPSSMEEALVEGEEITLGAVDLVVLAPSLSTSDSEAFLAARRRSTSSPIPVIVLCTPVREAPALPDEEEAIRSVPWSTTRERLVREIEEVLLEARFTVHSKRATAAEEKMGYTTDETS